MAIKRIRIRDFIPAGGLYQIGRCVLSTGEEFPLHTHDFPELFWIESGTGVHLINQERVPLAAGHLVLIRPDDVHGFRADGAQLAIVNVAVPPKLLADLRARYFSGRDWPWTGDKLPAMRTLDEESLLRMSKRGERLAARFGGKHERLEIDRFLLDLLDDLTAPAGSSLAGRGALPGWLDEAMMKLAGNPELLHGGVPALAKVAGYSREHVNRVARKATGLTATDLINSVRLERAAALLRMSSTSLLDIAGECGLPNVGHFYRLFHRRFGTTPHRYRQHHQALLRGGD